MTSESSKTEAETAAIASASEPIEITTEESTVVFSDSDPKEDDSSDCQEEDDVYESQEEEKEYDNNESQEVDEDDDDEEEEDEDEDKENDVVDDGDSIVDDGDSTSSQPEYGVDDFDESDYWSPDEDSYTDEEDERQARLYRRNLHFSHVLNIHIIHCSNLSISNDHLINFGHFRVFWWKKGFVHVSYGVDQFYLNLWTVNIHSPVKGRTQLQYAQDMAKMCLRKHNALNETDVKLDHVVRVTGSRMGRAVSYIWSEEQDTLVEYQAKVVKKLKCKTYPCFCRPSPSKIKISKSK